ncbi:hypothetical protein Efla_003513 [Eimeria flavescens]
MRRPFSLPGDSSSSSSLPQLQRGEADEGSSRQAAASAVCRRGRQQQALLLPAARKQQPRRCNSRGCQQQAAAAPGRCIAPNLAGCCSLLACGIRRGGAGGRSSCLPGQQQLCRKGRLEPHNASHARVPPRPGGASSADRAAGWRRRGRHQPPPLAGGLLPGPKKKPARGLKGKASPHKETQIGHWRHNRQQPAAEQPMARRSSSAPLASGALQQPEAPQRAGRLPAAEPAAEIGEEAPVRGVYTRIHSNRPPAAEGTGEQAADSGSLPSFSEAFCVLLLIN